MLYKLKLPLVFSLLALLSRGKASIFYDKIVELAEWLSVSKLNDSDESASVASYMLDEVTTYYTIDIKRNP